MIAFPSRWFLSFIASGKKYAATKGRSTLRTAEASLLVTTTTTTSLPPGLFQFFGVTYSGRSVQVTRENIAMDSMMTAAL